MSKLASVLAELKKDKVAIGGLTEVPRESGGISWGLVGLDRMFKTRGVPRGRITQLVAESNAGKSTMALGVIAALHADVDAGRTPRGTVVFIDTERTFEEDYARVIGIDVDNPDRFILMRPDDGVDAIDAMERLINTGEIDLVVLDSVTFMIPRAMLEADVGKQLPAVQSRQNSMMVQRLVGPLAKHNVALLVVNHLGGTMRADHYGNPILEPRGGAMLLNATSAMLWLKKTARPVGTDGKPTKDMNDSVAVAVTIRIHKNKLGRQNYELPARMVFGSGFDSVYDLFNTAVTLGVFEQRGAGVYWGTEKWNGENATVSALAEDGELFRWVREAGLAADGVK